MKNKTDLAALKAAVVMLSLDSRAREALHKMDLEDEHHVRVISRVLQAGAMTSPNKLRLIAALQDRGVRPSRGALEKLAVAVRADPQGRAALVFAGD